MQLQNCSGLELKILRSVGEGGIEKCQWRCARGEAGETERDTETDSHSNGARSEQRRGEESGEQSRAEQSSRVVARCGPRRQGTEKTEEKAGFGWGYEQDFCPRGTRFMCHGTIIKLPRQGARKNATPSSSGPSTHTTVQSHHHQPFVPSDAFPFSGLPTVASHPGGAESAGRSVEVVFSRVKTVLFSPHRCLPDPDADAVQQQPPTVSAVPVLCCGLWRRPPAPTRAQRRSSGRPRQQTLSVWYPRHRILFFYSCLRRSSTIAIRLVFGSNLPSPDTIMRISVACQDLALWSINPYDT